MGKKDFQVAIMHGHGKEYKRVKEYVEECGFSPRVLIEEFSFDFILERLRNLIWDDIHYVIVIMTRDDLMASGLKRARQNVVFELGYCLGSFDSLPEDGKFKPEHAIMVLAEEDTELFADIHGLTLIYFREGELDERKELILKSMQRSYRKAKKYFDL